jgi:ABC-type sugar transport system permease subunit
VYIYSNFYQYQQAEYGAAVAVLLCLIIVTLTWLQLRFLERREDAP